MALSPIEQEMAARRRDNQRLGSGNARASYAEREQDLRDREGEVFSRARQRAIDSRAGFIARNPNAVSPFERQAILGRAQQIEDRNALQGHEMRMLEQQGQNAIGVEREKAEGLKSQGSIAAQLNKDAAIETAKINGQNSVNLANAQGANNLTLAEKQLAADQAKHTATLASNEKIAGINAKTEEYKADATVDVQTEKNKGLQTQYDLERQAEQFKHENAKELAQLRVEGRAPSNAEINAWFMEKDKPENKGLSFSEWFRRQKGA